jgi:hypothetical protein
MPAVDDPASTEAGVILMGLDTGHLLAGLAVARLADDPAAVLLLVDQAQHTGAASLPISSLVTAGVRSWRAVRAPLIAAGCGGDGSASPRLAWTRAYRALARCYVGELGPATAVYLTACLLRHAEMDRYCETWP